MERKALEKRSRLEEASEESAELRRTAPGGATALEKRSRLEEASEDSAELRRTVPGGATALGKRSRLEKAREDAGKSPVRTPGPTRLKRRMGKPHPPCRRAQLLP